MFDTNRLKIPNICAYLLYAENEACATKTKMPY